MANKITAYHVNDNNGEKERNNNTWMNEPNNNDSKVLNFHENETMATEGKNNTKYYSDIDMSKGAKTYETRAIKRFYIYTGILPDCIEFTNGERLMAKIMKILGQIWTKIILPPSAYFTISSFGLSPLVAIMMGITCFAMAFFFFEKVDLVVSKSIDANEVLHDPEACKKFHDMVKKWDKNIFVFWLLAIIKSPILPIMLPGFIMTIIRQNYIAVGIVGACIFFCVSETSGMSYVPFSKVFMGEKNEIEIKQFFRSIEDIVLNPNNNITKEKMKKILRQNQFKFESRMRERKKALFYHPWSIFFGVVSIVYCAFVIATFKLTDVLLYDIGMVVSIAGILFLMLNMLLIPSAKVITQGAIVFNKCRQKLDYLDFLQGIEEKLGIRYEIFELWLDKMKKIATVHILGIPVDDEILKKLLAAAASITSLAVAYAAREMFF